MIEFDASKITIEIVSLKSITQALGGSIQVLDESLSGDKEVFKRIPLPLAVARAFIMRHKKITKYLKPVYTALIKYDDRVIAMERHPMGSMGELVTEGLDGTPKWWTPYSESNLQTYVYPLLKNKTRKWYFDGRYVYSFDEPTLDHTIKNASAVTADNKFRKLNTLALDLQEVSNADKLQPQERTCIAFVSSTGDYSISPPIWKDVTTVGGIKEDVLSTQFDKLNESMSVNLNFALKAGKEIGKMFGYNCVEPLQLPRLMIELHTVNLPNIPKEVKATYDIGISFTHTFAWLLGLLHKADTLDTFITMRSLMKYLTQKGLYHNSAYVPTNIFVEDRQISDVPVLNLDELMQNTDFTQDLWSKIIHNATKANRKNSRTNIGSLMIES